MRLLLDTHTFLWWLAGESALSAAARKAIADEKNTILVSAASAWEIATKYRIGKLPGVASIVGNLGETITDQGFTALPISLQHGQVAGTLPGTHRDPFDRILVAQALLEKLILVSNERPFDRFGVSRLW
jgi:PIN domain nuclease of toxin-antitoxin system